MESIKTEKEFKKYWNKESVVVKFTADWCGPCQMLKPLIERLSRDEKYKDIAFVEVDVDYDELRTVSDMMNIRSVPTLVFVKNGIIQRMSTGLVSEETLRKNLALLL